MNKSGKNWFAVSSRSLSYKKPYFALQREYKEAEAEGMEEVKEEFGDVDMLIMEKIVEKLTVIAAKIDGTSLSITSDGSRGEDQPSMLIAEQQQSQQQRSSPPPDRDSLEAAISHQKRANTQQWNDLQSSRLGHFTSFPITFPSALPINSGTVLPVTIVGTNMSFRSDGNSSTRDGGSHDSLRVKMLTYDRKEDWDIFYVPF